MLLEEQQVPSRDDLVAAAIRQMARDLRAHERSRAADVAEVLDRTTTYLRNRLGRCPTPNEVARTGGLEIEDVLDEINRRRRTVPRAPAPRGPRTRVPA
jgi:DNA-directed RNA polymerase specialized sigma subunit